ncbi:hypothetical protein GCM10009613_11660 [Pseudonocardia kongjuensis]|uniref:Uncharacterized protein n=1 Tax=Pseudonocardia kongjuensis TaxID=102227 RepID=A0ABN1XJ68_9PSEU
MDAEWWDIVNAIAQSVGALGTMGALLIAAFTYRGQVRDRRQAQAARVLTRGVANEGERGLGIRVMNGSDQSIYTVAFARRVNLDDPDSLGAAGPHGIGVARGVGPWADALLPGEDMAYHPPDGAEKQLLGVVFTDAAGRTWIRWNDSGAPRTVWLTRDATRIERARLRVRALFQRAHSSL